VKPRYRMQGFLRGAVLMAIAGGPADEASKQVRDAAPGEVIVAEGKPLLQARGGVFLVERRKVARA
jgi:hypothetical protein